MSFAVVAFVAFAVFLYVRANRRHRAQWLKKLDLVGRWRLEDGQAELVLKGSLDGGEFSYSAPAGDKAVTRESLGLWEVRGNRLTLRTRETTQTMDLYLFKPGQIGLEESGGQRFVYSKVPDNVVPLRRG